MTMPIPAEKCHYCDVAAVVCCDFLVTMLPPRTCDRPLCSEHLRRVGHICNRKRKSLSDTIDYCKDHP